MTLTPEKLDEIERLAEDVKKAGSWASDEYDHYMDFITQAFENPATVRELVRRARIAEFLIETAESYGTWTGSAPSPAEFHISWGTQQHSPVFEPLAELNEAAKRWAQEQLEENGHD